MKPVKVLVTMKKNLLSCNNKTNSTTRLLFSNS